MIVVDTSVWVEFFRGLRADVVRQLRKLLDESLVLLTSPIFLELCSGASKADASQLKFLLSALPVVYPQNSTWDLVDSWIDQARAKGERFSVIDLLIGAHAHEYQAEVWSLDHDFRRLAKLKLISVYKA